MPNYKLLFLSLCLVTFSLSSCLEDSCDETRTFIEFELLYAHPEEFRIAPTFQEERALETPGKIYYINDMVMINERYEGIHIYDNSVPSSPEKIGFLAIPGNLDVSVRGNLLYADSYVDLVTIDISDLRNPTLLSRDELVFSVYSWFTDDLGYYIGTKETNRVEERSCEDESVIFGSGRVFIDADGLGAFDNTAAPTGNTSTANEITGVGGSFARFSVIDNNLYVLNQRDLVAYSLTNPTAPVRTQTTTVSNQIETLFPYNEFLFIGSTDGMFIYDRVNPDAPAYVSEFIHANACDPVFVKDDIAYVTLRNGTQCQNFINQLDVIDVSNITNPTLIKSYDMDHPHGLTVVDNNLYICEGTFGLKVFETDDQEDIDDNKIGEIKDVHAYDAIALSSSHLLIIGDDGLYQYDSSNPAELEEMSFIQTKND